MIAFIAISVSYFDDIPSLPDTENMTIAFIKCTTFPQIMNLCNFISGFIEANYILYEWVEGNDKKCMNVLNMLGDILSYY